MKNNPSHERLTIIGVWSLTISVVLLLVYIWIQKEQPIVAAPLEDKVPQPVTEDRLAVEDQFTELPAFELEASGFNISRLASIHTIIPNRPRQEVQQYTVVSGDSVFGIAKKFSIKPETVLWANYDQLQDNPHEISIGMVLQIPPVDGVYYQWQEGDTLESVANKFKTKVDEILNWPGNKLDLANPGVSEDAWVMIPGGQREFRTWIIPQIARDRAGVSKSVYGPGACEGNYEGAYGSGSFIWPTVTRTLSGNDFWSGHLAIDIAASISDPVFASDGGVIVFAGWATGGYGNMVMIDHGNGYQTVYAHLNSVYVGCGRSVYQGDVIAEAGSTGNSTGSHLHFEIRIWGQFINPWYVLP